MTHNRGRPKATPATQNASRKFSWGSKEVRGNLVDVFFVKKCSETRLQASIIPKFSPRWYPRTSFKNGEGQKGKRRGGRFRHGCRGMGAPPHN